MGENPHAVDTAGISVAKLRYMAVIITGVLCGIAGTFISISLSSSFVRDITAGMGFMALAALIFANWRAWPALGACLLFGFLQASGTFLQGKQLFGVAIPVQFINMLPYLHDRDPARGLHRKIHSAQGQRPSLHQGPMT